MGVLAVMFAVSYEYEIYSAINKTFPSDLVRRLKGSAAGQDAGFSNPASAKSATVNVVTYSDANIVMVGVSITATGPSAETFPAYNVVNRGLAEILRWVC